MTTMIPTHKRSDGTDCSGCGCEHSEIGINTGGIHLVGCCAMREVHGTFRFDEETGECIQWPLCCAEHEHTGPDEPDGVCAAHRPTKPEHTVVLTAHGPILPLDEPIIRLAITEVISGKPNDPQTEVVLADERHIALPSSLVPRDPKYNEPIAGEVEVRGYVMLRSGVLIPSVGRQFAQKRIDALFRRIQRAAFEHTFSWGEFHKERLMIERGQGDPQSIVASMVRRKDRTMGLSLSADMDAGRIDISVTAQALVINPHNPEDGGREFHHVAPLTSEVAVVTPVLGGSETVVLAEVAAAGAN